MKQKDIIVLIVVVIVSGVSSYFLANLLFGGEKNYTLKAPIVEPISSTFDTPSEQYFNKNSIDSSKTITIGDSTNTDPFKSN